VDRTGLGIMAQQTTALDITTLVIAVIGLVAGVASLGWQVVSWRLTGPVVRVEIGYGIEVIAGNLGQDIVYVRAINVGRSPVEIEGWGFRLPDGKTIIDMAPEPGSVPPLPITLDGGHAQEWRMSLRRLVGSRESEGYPPTRVRGMVRLGTGEVRSKKTMEIWRRPMDYGLGQEDLAALGRIALISTGIEMVVEAMIWELLGVEEAPGRAVTERARPFWLTERLERLAKRTDLEPTLASDVIEFARVSKTMFKVRNDNLHSVWVSLETGKAIRLRSVLADGHEGPQFTADIAVAGAGQLAAQADIMETFARAGYELLERLQAR